MNHSAFIELHRDALRFSAGHLMLLSAGERETLHGHDYQVSVALRTDPGNEAFALDLRQMRILMQALCDRLDYRFLIPADSPHLRCEDTESHWRIHFKNQAFELLKTDTVLLPLPNITLEALSIWFVSQLTQDPASLASQGIQAIRVKVFNGRSESGASFWGSWSEIH